MRSAVVRSRKTLARQVSNGQAARHFGLNTRETNVALDLATDYTV